MTDAGQDQPGDDQSNEGERDKKANWSGRSNDIPTIVTGAVALFVGALAAVGVAGDVLTRAVRNLPYLMSALLAIVLFAALALYFVRPRDGLRSEARANVLQRRFLSVIAIAVSATVLTGAMSVADREQPAIALQASYADGQVTLTVESRAAGLATTDQLTVQVLGLGQFSVIDKQTVEICEQVFAHSISNDLGTDLQILLNEKYNEKYNDEPLYTGSVSVLLSERLGPDSSGSIDSATKLDLPAGLYQGVCAFSPLPSDQIESSRSSASYLRLSNCNESSKRSPAPPATVTVTTTAAPSWGWDQSSNCLPALSGSATTPATPTG